MLEEKGSDKGLRFLFFHFDLRPEEKKRGKRARPTTRDHGFQRRLLTSGDVRHRSSIHFLATEKSDESLFRLPRGKFRTELRAQKAKEKLRSEKRGALCFFLRK